MDKAPVRIERRAPGDADTLPADWHPVLRRVMSARGIRSAADLDASLSGLAHVRDLGGVERAVARLVTAIENGEAILIVGDFDADGATSTALAVRALKRMGAPAVDYLVPDRFRFGYGLTPEIVAVAAERAPQVIVTVDNGVSSIDGVAAARAAGIDVIVTDHHLPGPVLPAATAIVNPNLDGDGFPSKHLAGVGVIFYVMSALRTALEAKGWFRGRRQESPRLVDLLDLVALGTVADVVVLDHNNRRLVAQGLQRLRAGAGQAGVRALAEIAGRDVRRLTTADLGFALGPRLNAAGRMADMSIGIACLLSDDPARCAGIAAQLDELNRTRRDTEQSMRDEAFRLAESIIGETTTTPAAICVCREDWHAGVLGIVAARLKDRFHRPAIVFAADDDGDTLRGSARSVPGLHVRDVLARVDSLEPGLITRFGGHAMAAGLSLRKSEYGRFTASFAAVVDEWLDASMRDKVLLSDGTLAAAEFDLDLARLLGEAAPWGNGFPEPRFDGVFEITDRRVVGEQHARLVLRPEGGDTTVAGIAFGAAGESWFENARHIEAVYKLDVNAWRGVETVQLVVDHARAVSV